MVMVAITQSPALIYQNLKKLHGKEKVGVVTNINKLPDKDYLIYTSFKDYQANPALDKACIVCGIPFKYEGKMQTLEMVDEIKYDMDFEDLIVKSKDLLKKDAVKSNEVKRIKGVIDKVIDTFKPSSVIDKVHTYVYSCTTNKNRTPVRVLFSDFVLKSFSKDYVLKKLKELKVKVKPESEETLKAIFEYMDTPIGKRFREACKKAFKEEKKKNGIPYDVIAREYEVDKFDVKTVLLNCTR